ncbi:hypothetical protein [Phormidesmis priestleyi]|uniref:hypothetical protein n=1 Tax=Phormidesmis priestleyi TaxID=268141 RepID=UPI0015E69F0B|nr:hypothetical protein [Phormidesmis priestleyi]
MARSYTLINPRSLVILRAKTNDKNRTQHAIDTSVSFVFGDTNTIKPCPLIKAEKLETQNGMRYSLNVCHLSLLPGLPEETLNNSPVPITALMPIAFSHSVGEESK